MMTKNIFNYQNFPGQHWPGILAEANGGAKFTNFEHAIVIGSGIAGLTAARVLADYFNRVTLIERDQQPLGPAYRPGVPQARHAHTLLPQGQKILEQLFPGFVRALLAYGAICIDSGSDIAYLDAGTWRKPRSQAADTTIASSRPLLETAIVQYLEKYPNIRMMQGYEIKGLIADKQGRRVTGVQLRGRPGTQSTVTELAANLVVDASGRHSRAPQWLEALGYTPPKETIVNALAGYATQIFQSPNDMEATWKKLYIRPYPPEGTRGGIILPMEGDRWCVTLIGLAGDYPPTDSEGFLAFARNLPTPLLYEAIKDAHPLTQPAGYRRTENRRRHYDNLSRYLEGFLVLGDAVYALNPIYAQGMTTAAIGSLVLDATLRKFKLTGQISGLAKYFYQNLSQAMTPHWKLATRKDQEWLKTLVMKGSQTQIKALADLPDLLPST